MKSVYNWIKLILKLLQNGKQQKPHVSLKMNGNSHKLYKITVVPEVNIFVSSTKTQRVEGRSVRVHSIINILSGEFVYRLIRIMCRSEETYLLSTCCFG